MAAQGTCPDGTIEETEIWWAKINVTMPIAFITLEHPETAATDCDGTEP